MEMKEIIKAYVQDRTDELVKTMIESMEGEDPKKLVETIHGVVDIIEITLSVIPSPLAPIYAMITEQSLKAICSDPKVAEMKDNLKKAIGIQTIGITVPRGGSEK